MSKYVELLINEIQLAHELSSILDDESSCLKNNKVEMLFDLAKQKDSIVQRFNHLEEERKSCDANLNDPEIKSLQNELMTLVEHCSKLNKINGAAILLIQNRVQKQLNCLLGEQNFVSLYSAKGTQEHNILNKY